MVNTTTVLTAIHILAAVIWVGGGVTIHIQGRRALASGDRQAMDKFSDDANWVGTRIYAPVSIVLLIAGIFLVDKYGADFSDLWVTLGLVAWFISFAIGVGYYGRADKRQKAIIASDGIDSPKFLALYRQVANVNAIEQTILLLVILDMVIKPT